MTFQGQHITMGAEARQTIIGASRDGLVRKMLTARASASVLANLYLLWHLFPTYFILMWKLSGCLVGRLGLVNDAWGGGGHVYFYLIIYMQGWLKSACHCLRVLLMWSFTLNRPFMALASQASLCTQCATHTLSNRWILIQISAFHHSPCLFTQNVFF